MAPLRRVRRLHVVALRARTAARCDADVTELLRRQPTATVIGVEGAGHSVQGDRPLELAGILSDFLFPDG